MVLSNVNSGERIKIIAILDSNIKSQAIRLGIFEGVELICLDTLHNGPIIMKNRMQEVAIGRKLADQIEIMKVV